MITTRTPRRVSIFGGGTDYPEYYENNAAAVLGTRLTPDEAGCVAGLVHSGLAPEG